MLGVPVDFAMENTQAVGYQVVCTKYRKFNLFEIAELILQ